MSKPLSSNADDIEIGYPAHLQLERQLRHAAGVGDFAAKDVALLLTLDALKFTFSLSGKCKFFSHSNQFQENYSSIPHSDVRKFSSFQYFD